MTWKPWVPFEETEAGGAYVAPEPAPPRPANADVDVSLLFRALASGQRWGFVARISALLGGFGITAVVAAFVVTLIRSAGPVRHGVALDGGPSGLGAGALLGWTIAACAGVGLAWLSHYARTARRSSTRDASQTMATVMSAFSGTRVLGVRMAVTRLAADDAAPVRVQADARYTRGAHRFEGELTVLGGTVTFEECVLGRLPS